MISDAQVHVNLGPLDSQKVSIKANPGWLNSSTALFILDLFPPLTPTFSDQTLSS